METVSLNYYDLLCLGPVGAGDNQVHSYCFRLSFFLMNAIAQRHFVDIKITSINVYLSFFD